ncbi:PucR family transcriptional regulator [Actinomadura alba]|uniref:PucR family transcriptional regulator ligand-binding domain-containing protein n=1 Tax=Actinomadura alba TaxID=406431 RepID=A0ABR7LLX0_9ACTN|nr:PucR family transcriptional regulator [Actinomadura alba]MBC6465490.1 PucR family transcriptional regulator ligand-binding domain-containing protein [Actinomadura alba]
MIYTPAEPSPPALRLASTGTLTYGLSVGEVLGVSTLAGARLIAGASGLDRIVQRLNVMEVPDILAWVKPHELLLTTGYPLRNTPQSLGRLVTDLDERGLAALAIKLGRYLDELPVEMIEQADRLGFPLILLPNDVGFDDILNQVLTDILNRQAAILARTEEVHRALVQIVLGGGGLQDVIDEVATLFDVAVIAVDGDRRMLAGAGPEEHVKAVCAAWVDGPGWSAAQPGFGGNGDHVVVPVVAGGFDHGRIIAYSASGALRETDVGILERAATVAALVITKQQAVAAVESKYRADFLRDILAGRAGADDRVIAHCAGFGWDLDRPVAVAVAELDSDGRSGGTAETRLGRTDRVPEPRTEDGRAKGGEERQAQDRLAAAWTAAVRRRDPKAAVASFAHEVVAVVGLSGDGDLDGLVRDATTMFGEHPGRRRTFSTGVSRVVACPTALPEAYEQAVKSVRVGRQLHGFGSLAHFNELGVYRLLSLVADAAELHAFVRETLGELAGDDDPEAVDLRRTLQVLLETNLNVAETARRLHFHYNTLRYRIGKLERMLGAFTEDAHLRLNLTLALHVLRMRGI